jgi:hypothetical protein
LWKNNGSNRQTQSTTTTTAATTATTTTRTGKYTKNNPVSVATADLKSLLKDVLDVNNPREYRIYPQQLDVIAHLVPGLECYALFPKTTVFYSGFISFSFIFYYLFFFFFFFFCFLSDGP